MNDKTLQVLLKLKDGMSAPLQAASGKASMASRAFTACGAAVMKLMAAFAAAIVIRAFVRFMGEAVRLAQEQEAAVTTLNAAMMAAGNYTEEASQALQNYATSLQHTLGIGDEVTIETMGIIEGLTKLSTEALPGAMEAVIQISNLYQVDYKNSAILLDKTLTSSLNAFSRYGIQIDMTADAQGRLNEILDATSAGMVIAEEKAKTYEGQVAMLEAGYGDLQEAIGRYITQSPKVVAVIGVLTEFVGKLTTATDAANDSSVDLVGTGFAAIVSGALSVVRAINAIIRIVNLALQTITSFLISLQSMGVGFEAFMVGTSNSILRFFHDTMEGVRDIYNTAVDFINQFPGINFSGMGDIPMLQVSGGTSASSGELERLRGVLENLQTGLMAVDATTDMAAQAQRDLAVAIENAGPVPEGVAAAGAGAGADTGTEAAEAAAAAAAAAAAEAAAVKKFEEYMRLIERGEEVEREYQAARTIALMLNEETNSMESDRLRALHSLVISVQEQIELTPSLELQQYRDSLIELIIAQKTYVETLEAMTAMINQGIMEGALGALSGLADATNFEVFGGDAMADLRNQGIAGGTLGAMSGTEDAISRLMKEKPGMSTWAQGMKTLGSTDFLAQMAGNVGQTLVGGGGFQDVMSSALPMIGSAFGPWGAAIGGIVGSLFGKKKNRGDSQANPVYVSVINADELARKLTNATLSLLSGASGRGGMSDIDMMLRRQSVGYAGG